MEFFANLGKLRPIKGVIRIAQEFLSVAVCPRGMINSKGGTSTSLQL